MAHHHNTCVKPPHFPFQPLKLNLQQEYVGDSLESLPKHFNSEMVLQGQEYHQKSSASQNSFFGSGSHMEVVA